MLRDLRKFRIRCIAVLAAAVFGVAFLLWPTGYFGQLHASVQQMQMLAVCKQYAYSKVCLMLMHS